MQSRESIVVGTDGSETAERAVDRAGVLARAFDATVHVVSVYSDDRSPLVSADRVTEPTPSRPSTERKSDSRSKVSRVRHTYRIERLGENLWRLRTSSAPK
jgi:nucleotide-binding universal stress UspA family protein